MRQDPQGVSALAHKTAMVCEAGSCIQLAVVMHALILNHATFAAHLAWLRHPAGGK